MYTTLISLEEGRDKNVKNNNDLVYYRNNLYAEGRWA